MDKEVTGIKYVHIIYRNEEKFSSRVVRFINNPETGIDSKLHLFVTPHKKVYNSVKEFENVILDESKENLINKYAPQCKWIISHDFLDVKDVFKVKRKYLKKIIYRYWGGGFGYQYKKGQPLKNVLKAVINCCLKRRINAFSAIGIAKNVDIMVLQTKLKDMRYYRMPYTNIESESILEKVRDSECVNDGIYNVALYHRGTVEGKHIEILKKLKRFGNKIRIYVPLSYGDEKYIEQVKAHIKNNSYDNVVVVDEFMEYEDYVSLINRMHIGIFNCDKSNALGNVAVYLFLRKKLFLNRNGLIKKAFDEDSIPHRFVDELDTISFDEFVADAGYPKDISYELMPLGRKKSIEAWAKIIQDFN